jgi:hypothetical protein
MFEKHDLKESGIEASIPEVMILMLDGKIFGRWKQ